MLRGVELPNRTHVEVRLMRQTSISRYSSFADHFYMFACSLVFIVSLSTPMYIRPVLPLSSYLVFPLVFYIQSDNLITCLVCLYLIIRCSNVPNGPGVEIDQGNHDEALVTCIIIVKL